MPVSLEPGPRVARMQILNVKAAHVAALADISAASISRWINGSIDLSHYEVQKIDRLLSDLELLTDRASGIPINFTNVARIKELVDNLHREEIAPPPKPSPEDLDMFARFNRDEDLTEISIRFRIDKTAVLGRVEKVIRHSEHISRKAAATLEE